MKNMSDVTTTTIAEAVSAAVQQLPPLRRWFATRMMAKQKVREDVYTMVAMKLAESSRAAAMMPPASYTALAAKPPGSGYGATEVEVYTADWSSFLKLLMEYLPMILDIIMKYFVLAVLLLCLGLAQGTPAAACDLDPLTRAHIRVAAKAYTFVGLTLPTRAVQVCGPDGCTTALVPVSRPAPVRAVLSAATRPLVRPTVVLQSAPVTTTAYSLPAVGDVTPDGGVVTSVTVTDTPATTTATAPVTVYTYQAATRRYNAWRPLLFGRWRARGGCGLFGWLR